MRAHHLFTALVLETTLYTLAAGWRAALPLALVLWAVAAFTLTLSGMLIGGVLWAVGYAAARPGRRRPGLADFNLYTCLAAGVVCALLILRAYAWAWG